MTVTFRERRRLRRQQGCATCGSPSVEYEAQAAAAPAGQLTRNFHIREFASRDGVAVPQQYRANVLELAKNLQQLRDKVGKPITVTSGYRSPAHNAKVGGAPRSQHLLAKAADIRVAGISPPQLYCMIEGMIAAGRMKVGGLGIYNSFVHYDIRGTNDRWTGTGVARPTCAKAVSGDSGSTMSSSAAAASTLPAQRSGAAGTVEIRVHRKAHSWDEDGIYVRGTERFKAEPGSAQDRILASMAAAEGGFDTVNMYDQGIVSWGIMQWTAHAGSLQRLLAFVRRRLGELGRSDLWSRLFPELDVRTAGSTNTLLHRAQPVTGKPALRTLFRGKPVAGQYDDATIRRWATIFALAGRDPVIQQLQREHARSEVTRAGAVRLGPTLATFKRSHCARRPLSGVWPAVCRELSDPPAAYETAYGRVADYVGHDVRAGALYFGMWTNNPAMTYLHLKRAIDRYATTTGSKLPAAWPAGWPGRFADTFEQVLRGSTFSYWGDAKAAAANRTSRTQKILGNLARSG
jgi:uncharacterized protein YcbK (DUF882 family)